jgi:ribosomal protein L37AE/L43A
MDNKNDTSIDVECPHCFKENKINLSTEIKCKHCEKSLIGHKYRKPFMSAMTALIIGAGGTYYINEQFESNRYPINIEYAIINSCVSYSDRPLLRKDYRNKENICICALKKVQKEIDY